MSTDTTIDQTHGNLRFDKKKEFEFYRDLLQNDFFRFWKKAIDHEHGGIYTCWTNDGSTRVSTDKYIWSQGRSLYIFSKYIRLLDKGCFTDDRSFLMAAAEGIYQFIHKHAILPEGEGVCAFLTEGDGKLKESIPGKGYYTSFYVDTFVIAGFAEYAALTKKSRILDEAFELYDRMQDYLNRGEIYSEPYQITPGFKAHGIPMILSNTAFVLYESAKKLGHPRCEQSLREAKGYSEEIFDQFYDPKTHLIRETVPLSSADEDAMIVNFYKPGHIIEDMWFQLEIVEASGMDSAYYQKIGDIVEASYQLGWDPIYGGILREVDINGKKPDGRRVGDPLERLIDQSWNSKLWWVHSETLYTTLLCYLKFKEERFLDLYEQCKAYSFKVFPNPNQEIGEWIQILDQDNKPMEKVVGLPVKDPYHIIRNFLKIVEICME